MSEPLAPKLTRLPFLAGDALLLGTAGFVCAQAKLPLDLWQVALVVACVGAGAALAIMPFLLEYRVASRLAEASQLTTVAAQLQHLDALCTQISGATGQWHAVQEGATTTAAAARQIADLMSAELKGFKDFMQRANDAEKTHLRLEVEKLHRAENDWLQVLVRMLDHVYALNVGALRSGQPTLIEQMGHFRDACHDATRRVGLVPFVPTPAEPFDAQKHQTLDGDDPPSPEAKIVETIANGYNFQGRLLRRALVRLQQDDAAPANPSEPAAESSAETQTPAPEATGQEPDAPPSEPS